MSANHVLYDLPGPKAVRRDRVYNVVFTALFVALIVWFVRGAYERGVFNDRWQVLWDPPRNQTAGGVWWDSIIMRGIVGTLTPVLIAIPIVMVLAVIVTIMRTSRRWWSRIPARVLTEVFRGVPVLLVILFGVLALNLPSMRAVALGLIVYNTAVVAEILRAGIAALPSGQKEAGLSVGLTPLQTMLQIQLPQAVRIMLPALVSQAVVLLKDSSLGFIIGYPELLTTIKNNYNYFGEQSKVVFVLVGFVLYVGINMLVSRLAHWIERKMGSQTKALVAPGTKVTAVGVGVNTRTAPDNPTPRSY